MGLSDFEFLTKLVYTCGDRIKLVHVQPFLGTNEFDAFVSGMNIFLETQLLVLRALPCPFIIEVKPRRMAKMRKFISRVRDIIG